ncbi:MAG: leucine-rich repeat domain-containing protein [Clostridia bacterium]|nr:leucine-rich repeat domain-containing protein [Clostridia bacterium]
MKKFSKLIAALALVLAAALLTSSALPALTRAEDRNSVQPTWTVPEGYNAHDYEKCVNFLEQTDENGVKNGDKLSDNYDPNDPASWGNCFRWTTVNSEQRIHKIYADVRQLYGSLDVSGCTELTELYCTNNSITELNVSGCTELTELYCTYNDITELDVTHNTALSVLNCGFNNLIELDVTHNTALTELYCYANSLIELDLAHNAALEWLSCDGNSFTELDLSNNPLLGYDHIYAEGGGIIGYVYNPDNEAYISAYPVDGEVFEGFFDESGTLISAGYLEDLVYYFGFSGTPHRHRYRPLLRRKRTHSRAG